MSRENQVTREGFEKLKKELEDLKGPTRMRIADAIREAKSHGDLRENAAYHECKLNQSRLESRIAELEKAVQLARVIERPEGEMASANLGSKVQLRDLEFDDEFTVTLVGSFEADPTKDLISIASPLGEAMLGKAIGDEIEVAAPAGTSRYRIVGLQ
jgi:transcription elongation factor GreA